MDLNRLNDEMKLQIMPDENQLHSDRSATLLLAFLELKIQTCKIDKGTLHCGAKPKAKTVYWKYIRVFTKDTMYFTIFNI